MTQPVTPAVLRPKQAAQYLGVSLPTFWRWAQADTFAPLFKLGPNSTAVLRSDLDAWLEKRKEAAQ